MATVRMKAILFSVLLFTLDGCGFRYNHEDRLASMAPYEQMEIPLPAAQTDVQPKRLSPQKFLQTHSGLIIGVDDAQASPTVTIEKRGDGYKLVFKWE